MTLDELWPEVPSDAVVQHGQRQLGRTYPCLEGASAHDCWVAAM